MKISQVQNPNMSEAPSYGSSFSRGTLVELEDASLFFLSGTASVDETGNVVGDTVEQQAERMFENIQGLFRGAGLDLDEIAASAVYIRPSLMEKGMEIVKDRYQQLDSGIWYPADVCRREWLIETDALAIRGNVGEIVAAYMAYHRKAMTGIHNGAPAEASATEIRRGYNRFLFVYDSAETSLEPEEFKQGVCQAYERITRVLERNGAAWSAVVNTRINIPRFLDRADQGQDYYGLFNAIRTDLFRQHGVAPFPSSTGIGIKYLRDALMFSISALAVYRAA